MKTHSRFKKHRCDLCNRTLQFRPSNPRVGKCKSCNVSVDLSAFIKVKNKELEEMYLEDGIDITKDGIDLTDFE